MRGMAVVTPDGIVGKVIAAYPDGLRGAAGHRSGFRRRRDLAEEPGARHAERPGNAACARWTTCRSRTRSKSGEWFYTSGDDRIFPRGFPVGVVEVGAARAAVQGDSGRAERSAARAGRCADHAGGRAPGDSRTRRRRISRVYRPRRRRSRRRPRPRDPANPAASRQRPRSRPGPKRTSCGRFISRSARRRSTISARARRASKPPDFTHLPSTPAAGSAAAATPPPRRQSGGPATGDPARRAAGLPDNPTASHAATIAAPPAQAPASAPASRAPQPANRRAAAPAHPVKQPAPRVPPPAPKSNPPAKGGSRRPAPG